MTKGPELVLMLLTMGLAAAAQAADAPSPRSLTVGDRWSLGLALGNFDVDTSDSDDPHLNEVSYALTLGYQPLRYLAIGAELLHVETARQFDEFNELTAFGASGATVSARLQWPLPEDITPYLRVGYTYLQLDEETQIADQPTGNSLGQLSFGAGIQGKYWFAEYINYGRLEGLYLEQMRVGLQFRF